MHEICRRRDLHVVCDVYLSELHNQLFHWIIRQSRSYKIFYRDYELRIGIEITTMESSDDTGICGISGVDAKSCKKKGSTLFWRAWNLLTLRLNAEFTL